MGVIKITMAAARIRMKKTLRQECNGEGCFGVRQEERRARTTFSQLNVCFLSSHCLRSWNGLVLFQLNFLTNYT